MPRRPLLVVLAGALLVSSAAAHGAWGATTWAVHAAAAPTTSKTVTLTWAAVPDASAYAVYEATSTTSTPGSYSSAKTGLTATSWTTGTLSAAKNYWFEVVADIGTNWVSAFSAATAESTVNSANPYCVQP